MVITYFHILEKAKWWHLKWEKVELKAFLEIFSRTSFFFFLRKKFFAGSDLFPTFLYKVMSWWKVTFKLSEIGPEKNARISKRELIPLKCLIWGTYFQNDYLHSPIISRGNINNVNCKMSSKIRSYRES